MEIKWNYKNQEHIFETREGDGVPYLSFKGLDDIGMALNGFSTRLGGVSKGKFATMNFSYSRKDDPENVLENFTRMARALKVERDRMVVSHQTHTVNVRRVTKADEGKGVIRPRDYKDVDGLITDVPGLTLVTLYADCVPLYLVDPVHRAIGLSHSGWRGTVKEMGRVTLEAMGEAFTTKPEDVTAAIGPSICRDCFEVGEEVVREFEAAFDCQYHKELIHPNGRPGKYHLDLWKANHIILQDAGVRPERIHTTNICTMCNSDYLFSHRRVGQERGNLAAFLCIR